MASNDYDNQRAKRVPPHVPLAALRTVAGLTLDEVCARVATQLGDGRAFTKGALSGLENGHRGASEDILRALERAYGLERDTIATDYLPRIGRAVA